jgi:hypothetical protein
MNCVELQRSLAETENGSSAEQQAHLKSCPQCSALVRELKLVASSATQLRGADEPSPRVWNSIEIALRQQGLIHPPRPHRSLIPPFGSRWGWSRWLAPAAAALLIVLSVYFYQHSLAVQLARNAPQPAVPATFSDMQIAGLNDDDLFEEISQQTPALRAQYEDNLRRVNQFIQDARSDVAANPNDEEAHRSLLAAYQQKAMLFELALDRSLP